MVGKRTRWPAREAPNPTVVGKRTRWSARGVPKPTVVGKRTRWSARGAPNPTVVGKRTRWSAREAPNPTVVGKRTRWSAREAPNPTVVGKRAAWIAPLDRVGRLAGRPGEREAARDHPHVGALRPDPARRPGRRRGAEPPLAGARRLHPPRRSGDLQLAAVGLQGAPQGRAHRPPGDGRHRRPGGAPAGPAAEGAVRRDRPLDRLRPQHLPAEGPQGWRLPARSHPRGDVHAAGQGPVLLLQGPAAVALPDPDQVPGRGAAPGRPAARPRVRDEGLLLLRHRRHRAAEVLRRAPRRVHPDLQPARLRVRDRARHLRSHGWFGQRGVPGRGRERGGHLRRLRRWVRSQRRGRARRRTRPVAVRGRARRARPRHPRHPDHPDPGRPRERPRRPRRPPLDGGGHAQERAGDGAQGGRHPRAVGHRRARRPGGRPEEVGRAARAGRGRAVRRRGLRRPPEPGQGLHRPRCARDRQRLRHPLPGRSRGSSSAPAG